MKPKVLCCAVLCGRGAFIHRVPWLCAPPPLAPQLTSALVKQYLGSDKEGTRRTIGATAREKMKERFRCEATPAFQRSLRTLVVNGYPAWYVQSFFDPEVLV